MTDYSRLSASWVDWATRAGLPHPTVSAHCDDCEISFESDDESFHLRTDGDWWVVDRINDRGKRYNNAAKLSNFDITEKYLIWRWATSARPELASGQLGADLYARGYAPGITVHQISEGFTEIRSSDGSAILTVVDATIFSHLISNSVDEIDKMVKQPIS